jgi:hypothetical protein
MINPDTMPTDARLVIMRGIRSFIKSANRWKLEGYVEHAIDDINAATSALEYYVDYIQPDTYVRLRKAIDDVKDAL